MGFTVKDRALIRSQGDIKGAGSRRGLRNRPLLIAAAAGSVLVLCALAFTGLWFVARLMSISELSATVRDEYRLTNTEFPFSSPGPDVRPAEDRIDAYLACRDALMDTITPKLEALTGRVLDTGRIQSVDSFLSMGDLYRFVDASTTAHLAALRANELSADEYLWLHGSVIHVLIGTPGPGKADAADPRRAVIERVATQMEELGRGDKAEGNRFSIDSLRSDLEKTYAARNPPKLDIAKFEVRSKLGSLLDILAIDPAFAESLRPNSTETP